MLVGATEALRLGFVDEILVGLILGPKVGVDVEIKLGILVGLDEGLRLGFADEIFVGLTLGPKVGVDVKIN